MRHSGATCGLVYNTAFHGRYAPILLPSNLLNLLDFSSEKSEYVYAERHKTKPKKQEEATMNTTYFDEMTFNCAAYERAKKERAERKQQIIESHGIDSPEMDAWYAEEKAAGPYPYSGGQMKAYWVYKMRRENDGDEFEMSDSLWDKERSDFVETLRKLGITEFTVTTQSTGLMDDIYGYTELGCTMVGLHTITKKALRWGEEKYETAKGILFKVN